MKNLVINKCMALIKKNSNHNDVKIAEIKYGLESIYLTFSKLIIICLLAILLNLFNEFVIFLIIYNIIRMPSFGLHATKSWICLTSSTLIFILFPLICKVIVLPMVIKICIGLLMIYIFYKYAPADTKKRPIINQIRRDVYKFISVIIVIIFTFLSVFIKDNFVSNSFIISLLVQAFIIMPQVYSIFKLPYNNYKNYININQG